MGEGLEKGDRKRKKREGWSASCNKAQRLWVIHNFAIFMVLSQPEPEPLRSRKY